MSDSLNREKLRLREAELIKTLQAIDGVLKNNDWKVLEDVLWSKRVADIERSILSEAKVKEPNILELKYLNGRRDEANRYLNLQEYGESLVKELEALKQKIK